MIKPPTILIVFALLPWLIGCQPDEQPRASSGPAPVESESQAADPKAKPALSASEIERRKRQGEALSRLFTGTRTTPESESNRRQSERARDSRQVKARDGGCCLVCGSTVKLEVDHRIALMNGGDNSIDNLGTLCDECHNEKTRYDYAIRKRRKKEVGKH